MKQYEIPEFIHILTRFLEATENYVAYGFCHRDIQYMYDMHLIKDNAIMAIEDKVREEAFRNNGVTFMLRHLATLLDKLFVVYDENEERLNGVDLFCYAAGQIHGEGQGMLSLIKDEEEAVKAIGGLGMMDSSDYHKFLHYASKNGGLEMIQSNHFVAKDLYQLVLVSADRTLRRIEDAVSRINRVTKYREILHNGYNFLYESIVINCGSIRNVLTSLGIPEPNTPIKEMPQPKKGDILFDMRLTAEFHAATKCTFEEITPELFHAILNLDFENGTLKIKEECKMKACNMIWHLYNYTSSPYKKAWRQKMLDHLKVSLSYYNSYSTKPRSPEASGESKEFHENLLEIIKEHRKRA